MRQQPLDRALTIELLAPPQRRKIPPLDQLPAGEAQLLHGGTALPGFPPCQPRQRAPQPWRRFAQLALEPLVEGAIEKPRGLLLGEFLEGRIDARFDWTRAQNLGAEAMDGADGGFFERFQSVLEVRALARLGSRR